MKPIITGILCGSFFCLIIAVLSTVGRYAMSDLDYIMSFLAVMVSCWLIAAIDGGTKSKHKVKNIKDARHNSNSEIERKGK